MPRPLGRHVHHDPRSLDYRAPVDDIAPATKVWHRHVAPFDQGDLGSCTGNAIAGLLATDPFYVADHELRMTETTARAIYSKATHLDTVAGVYPPTDTGSTGLAAAKAAVALGYATRYRWGFGINDLIRIVAGLGPVAVGADWHEGFDHPEPNGLVALTGAVRGGHEWEIVGYHHDTQLLECVNSWGARWGVHGRFFVTVPDMAELLARRGDVVTFA